LSHALRREPDRARAGDNRGDPVHRHLDLPCELGSGQAKLAQLFGKMLAGMNRCAGHDYAPSVIVYYLHILGAGRSFRPREANPPLIAENERAQAFYERYGFRAFANEPRRLFLPLETFEKLGM